MNNFEHKHFGKQNFDMYYPQQYGYIQILHFSSIMLLRKSRKHLQGASNRDQSHLHQTCFSATTSIVPTTQILESKKSTICSTSHLKKRKPQQKENSIHEVSNAYDECKQSQRFLSVQKRLKAIYRGRKNIVKNIDGWGFDSRGYISRQQFKTKIKEKISEDLSEEQVDKIFSKFGGNLQILDVKSLLGLIHQTNQGILFNQTLFRPTSNKARQKMIQNLKQNLQCYQKVQKRGLTDTVINQILSKVNTSVCRMRDTKEGKIANNKETFFQDLLQFSHFSQYEKQLLESIQQTVNYSQLYQLVRSHKNIDNIFTDPVLRKTKIRKYPSEMAVDQSETFCNKMMKSTSNLAKTQSIEGKKTFLNPLTFMNINQQTSRFGKSNFTKQSSDWFTINHHIPKSSNQKQTTKTTLKSEQNMNRIRHQNKLQTIRNFRQKQQQNIAIRQQLALSRNDRRLQRIRNEQQAYNYVNFIKKRWD